MTYAEKNLAPGEHIVYRARYHWVIYRTALLFAALAVLLAAASVYASRTAPDEPVGRYARLVSLGFLVLAAVVWLARKTRAAADEFVITNRRVIRKVGLVSREIQQAPLDRIQDVTVDQGVFGRLLGYGHVMLETASERGSFVFPTLADPEAFRNRLWGRDPSADAPEAAPTPSAGVESAARRLADLEEMRRRGLLTTDEYLAKRKQIVEGL